MRKKELVSPSTFNIYNLGVTAVLNQITILLLKIYYIRLELIY